MIAVLMSTSTRPIGPVDAEHGWLPPLLAMPDCVSSRCRMTAMPRMSVVNAPLPYELYVVAEPGASVQQPKMP